MSPIPIGVQIEIVEERLAGVAPTSTDPCYLLHSGVTGAETLTSLAAARDAFQATPGLVRIAEAYFGEAAPARTLHVAPLIAGSGGPDIEGSAAAFGTEMGPGQLCAPEVDEPADIAALAGWAFDTNRIYLPDVPADPDPAAYGPCATAVRASSGDGRFTGGLTDGLLAPTGGTPQVVPASIGAAGLIARLDLTTGNPGLAAAGEQGECRYLVGIDSEVSAEHRNALADHGINTFRSVYGNTRLYGFRTMADPTAMPIWWDLSGSRVVMAIRAREAAVAERFMFGQVDAEGGFLTRYESALAGELAELQSVGAIFGTDTRPGYSVRAGWDINPITDLAQGMVRSSIAFKVSPFAEQIHLAILRRGVHQEV